MSLSGDHRNAEITVIGLELISSDTIILQEVRKQLGKKQVCLVLQTVTDVCRVVTSSENLKQLDLNGRALYYYEVEESECLVEIKVVRKGFNRRFLLYKVKKLGKTFVPAGGLGTGLM